MKLIIYSFSLFICCAVATLSANWRLTWSDEFNTLDTTKWNIRDKSGNYGNGELQWYHPNQTSVNNGSLVISGIKKAWGGETYLSSWIDTQDKALFTYGRYEIRAQMAGGHGTWPALWLLSQTLCWAVGAEIDIGEFRGSYPTAIGQFLHYASGCCAIYGSCISSQGQAWTVPSDLTQGFHVYAFEWFSNNMTWYVDDVVYTSFKTSVLTQQDPSPHYWIINLALGGSYPGNPDSTTVFPTNLTVDYVRNYVWRVSCTGETCSGNGQCNPTSVLCQCNPGWVGASCEQNVASFVSTFDAITNLDTIPNGWGYPPYTIFNQNSAVISSSAMKLTLSNSGCPANCYGGDYSSGAWQSIPRYTYGTFAFQAKSSNVPGTSFTLSAAGEQVLLEQVAFSFLGNTPTQVQLFTWTSNYVYLQTTINLGFDASKAYHTYTFQYAPLWVVWLVDGVQVFNSSGVVQPQALRLGPGAYYAVEPDWYGPFTYNGPSSVHLTQFNWQMTI